MIELSESEWKTRKARIDPRLTAAGWTVVPHADAGRERRAVEEYPTVNGPADYALCLEGCVLGIVEGKRVGVGPQEVMTQAERYARGLTDNPHNFDGFRVPFLYATNGERIWFRDARHPLNTARPVAHFHTPAALRELLGRDFDGACGWFKSHPNNPPRLRPYQLEANNAVEEALAGRKRHMLVAMATGTGKTFTMVNQVHRLMKSGVGKRILFLVDRRALAAQAVRAFASFEAERGLKFDQVYEVYSQRFQQGDFEEGEKWDPKVLPNAYLTDPQPGHAFVYVCTIQRMAINLFGRDVVPHLGGEPVEEDAEGLEIPVHAFDVIVADECHRGYTAKENAIWRQTLDHFDGVKIGLTATPASHTTNYFENVVYRYEYARAVAEGFLVDYDVVKVKSDVRLKGVFLREGDQVSYVDTGTGAEQLDLLEDEREYDASDIERRVTAPESNRRILGEIKRYAEEHEREHGRFPKTLIFATNDLPHVSHADQLVALGREVFGRGQAFVEKITGRVDRPLQRIREFRNRPEPHVAVTVDLLTTGVDIPDLEFIVFLRPVKSRILFEQMLGRGTRKGETYPDKSHFTVFDCFDGTLLEYFRNATAITSEPPETESKSIAEIIQAIWDNRDRDYNVKCLVRRLQRIDKQMSGKARDLFAAYLPDGDVGRFATRLPAQLKQAFTETMTLLRNESFQQLLVDYPRKQDPFVVALDAPDSVTSELLVRDGTGQGYKPEDYLAAFARFVAEKQAEVSGIEILLDRPRDWDSAALTELKERLATAPQRFTVAMLELAHRFYYQKPQVDLISMVKHAARHTEPLLTAEERAARAVAKVAEDRALTAEQQAWLDRMRETLATNLSIGQEHFDFVPVLSRAGGWGKANRVFDRALPELVRTLNEAMAA